MTNKISYRYWLTKRLFKRVCIILIVLIQISILSGCYDNREPDDRAHVVAIGLDKGKSNMLRMTIQISVPMAVEGEGGGGGGGEKGKSSTIITVEAPTIYAGINMINTYHSRQICLLHVIAVVFSKELVKEGISKYIHTFIRGREFRPNMYIAVSTTSAEEYLHSVQSVLASNPSEYYFMTYSSNIYTGLIPKTQFFDFHTRIENTYSQAVAILVGVDRYESIEDVEVENSSSMEKERTYPFSGDFKAGDLPKVSEEKLQAMGLAVFDGPRMVGELDGQETSYYQMVTGEFNYSYMVFPDTEEKNSFIQLNVKKSRLPVRKVQMVNGKPNIYVRISLEADILSIQSGKNYKDIKKINIIEESIEDFLEEEILRCLKRTAKEFKSDIFAFGKVVKGSFLTWKEWEDFNWLRRYKDSIFEVEVDLKIRRTGLMIIYLRDYKVFLPVVA